MPAVLICKLFKNWASYINLQYGIIVDQKPFIKVAVKLCAHAINCFINIAEIKLFTLLNSRYLLTNTGSW